MSGQAHWMKEAKHFGVMVHYISKTQPRSGEHEQDFNRMIDGFNLDKFMNQLKYTGADWLIFTLGQNTGYYCSYNRYLEGIAPGFCSRRDLGLEIAVRVKEADMKFIAYLPAEVDGNEKLRGPFGWDLHPSDKSEFMIRYMAFVKDYAVKFGHLLDGWWFDGCYNTSEKKFTRTKGWDNSRFDRDLWFTNARSGNPKAAISMNPGANNMEYVFDIEDYLAGEALFGIYPPEHLPNGMQPHVLFWMDCKWGHYWHGPGEIEVPKVSEEELYEFIAACKQMGAAATINIGIYEDGSLAEESVEMLHSVSKRLDEMASNTSTE